MSDLDDSFAKLLSRQPTDAERQRLYQVRDALGLKNNDALWLVLMALEHYQGQYEQFPAKIAQAAKDTLTGFKATAEATAKAAAEAAKADLAAAVATAAHRVADQVAGTRELRWGVGLSLAMAVLIACALGFGFYMESVGRASGLVEGYAAARDETAAAAWANTPQGKAAYQLAQAGSIDILTRCDLPGWRIEKGACYPDQAPGGKLHGWRLKPDASARAGQ